MKKEPQQKTFIHYNVLPESREWRIGRTYRIKLVMKQVSKNEDGADFEILDATSLEPGEARRRAFISDSGSYGGRA